jgi:basic membrane protein A and related proteins
MKKTTAGLAVLVLVLTVAGCGGGGKKSNGSANNGTTTTSASGKTSKVKVGLVTDVGGLNDRGFNHLAYVGVQRAKAQLGTDFHVNLSQSSGEYVPNLTAFARQGYGIIIGVGFTEANAIDTVANIFKDRKFAIVDVDQTTEPHKPPNLLGLLFREQEVGYLAGYLAGLEEKRLPGPDVVGSVGGQKQPPVDRFIAGFQAGAKAADPGIKTLNAYSQDFVKQDICKSIALNQIAAGAGVVFQVAGGCGLGVIKAAAQKNVWAIGVDADQAYIDPKHILTSAKKNVDVAVYKAIQAVVNGTFKGGNVVYGLKDNGVSLGTINARVPKSEVAQVKKIQQQIVAGQINIPTTVK